MIKKVKFIVTVKNQDVSKNIVNVTNKEFTAIICVNVVGA